MVALNAEKTALEPTLFRQTRSTRIVMYAWWAPVSIEEAEAMERGTGTPGRGIGQRAGEVVARG